MITGRSHDVIITNTETNVYILFIGGKRVGKVSLRSYASPTGGYKCWKNTINPKKRFSTAKAALQDLGTTWNELQKKFSAIVESRKP